MADRRLRRHLSQDEMDRALGCFILGYPKDMLLMSLVCPRVLSPECGTGLLRPEMLVICMLGGENAQPMRFKTDFWRFRHGATNLTMQQRYVGTSRTLPVCA